MPKKGSSTSAYVRIQGKFTVNIVTGCYDWRRSLSSQGRYPTIGIQGQRRPDYAYRVAWAAVNGPIPTTPPPDGSSRWEIHHRCMNNRCVNPDHLELLTRREHTARHNKVRADIRLAKAA